MHRAPIPLCMASQPLPPPPSPVHIALVPQSTEPRSPQCVVLCCPGALVPWCMEPRYPQCRAPQHLKAGSPGTSMHTAPVLCTLVHGGWVPPLLWGPSTPGHGAPVSPLKSALVPVRCGALFPQCMKPWDPALPQPASERGSTPRGCTSTPLHPCPAPRTDSKLVRTELFPAFLSLVTSCELLESHFVFVRTSGLDYTHGG